MKTTTSTQPHPTQPFFKKEDTELIKYIKKRKEIKTQLIKSSPAIKKNKYK
jgi:hypothetical protein